MIKHAPLIALLGVLLAACGSDDEANNATASGSPGSSGSGDPGASSGNNPAGGDFALCGGAIFGEGGALDEAEYEHQARLWDRPTIDCRLGPKFSDLEPGAKDDRPTAWEPEHLQAGDGALAWCAVDRGREVDPDHSLAGLVADLLEGAVPPTAWERRASGLGSAS